MPVAPAAAIATRSEPEIGKLRWRCRRGMRELDELLSRYLDTKYRGVSPMRQAAFRRLLDAADPLIHAYLLGNEPPPDAELAELLAELTDWSTNLT